MANGHVTALSLNVRSAPNGAIVGLLARGTPVDIIAASDKWLRVSSQSGGKATTGWVSAEFVALSGSGAPPGAPAAGAPAASDPPPAEDATHKVSVSGNKAIAPDGKSFAVKKGSGFYTLGVTSLRSWLDNNAPSVSPSLRNVVRAVSLNEGRLEAINSYDNAFLSFGVFQWTAGPEDDPGELAGLLDLLAATESQVFQDFFAAYGIGVKITAKAKNRLTTGYLTLNGTVLDRVALKQQLRAPEWAYRFWRAGHFDAVRRCEFQHAGARVSVFLELPVAGFRVGEWLTSECGIALVLDEHVNRPGHVPATLGKAIARNGATNPAGWTSTEEAKLIEIYIEEREKTSMTDPANRAARIMDCVHANTLSDDRGSFLMSGVT